VEELLLAEFAGGGDSISPSAFDVDAGAAKVISKYWSRNRE